MKIKKLFFISMAFLIILIIGTFIILTNKTDKRHLNYDKKVLNNNSNNDDFNDTKDINNKIIEEIDDFQNNSIITNDPTIENTNK